MRVIISDIDGTLMDTNDLHVEAWAQAFATVGHHVPRAPIHRQIGKGSQLQQSTKIVQNSWQQDSRKGWTHAPWQLPTNIKQVNWAALPSNPPLD